MSAEEAERVFGYVPRGATAQRPRPTGTLEQILADINGAVEALPPGAAVADDLARIERALARIERALKGQR